MGGGSSGSTTSTQTNQPWAQEQAPLASIYTQAQNLDTSAVPQYYPSNTYAPLTGQQQGLMSNLIGATATGGNSALQGANTTLANTLSPGYTAQTGATFNGANNVLGNEMSSQYLNPANSPAYSTAISNAEAQAVPGATASFDAGNRSDSGLASAAGASAATNAAAGLAQQQYQQNQGIQNQAAAQSSNNYLTQGQQQIQGSFYAPFVDQQQTSDMNTALGTAGQAQTNNQNQINANVASYNYGQMLPWNQLGLEESAITGTGSPGGTSTTQQPYFSNTAGNVEAGVGAAASVAMVAAMI